VGIGAYALKDNSDRSFLVAVGDSALFNNGTGASAVDHATKNTAIGSKALLANTTGYQNTALGYMAGDNITSGSNNIIIGSSVDAPSATGNNQLNIGNTLYGDLANGYLGLGTTTPAATLDVAGTLRYVDGKQAAGLILVSDASGNAGWASGDTVNSGGWTVNGNYVFNNTDSVGIGTATPTATLDVAGIMRYADGKQGAGLILVSDASGNAGWASGDTVNSGGWTVSGNYIYNITDSIGIGTATPLAELDVNGRIVQTGTGFSVFLGEGAGANDDLSDNRNVIIGYNAGNANTSGYFNTVIGHEALNVNTSGFNNTANGFYALKSNTTGSSNTATGYLSLNYNTTGESNAAFGSGTLNKNTTGNSNTATGEDALYKNTTGSANIATGAYALFNNTNRSHLVAFGDSALFNNGIGATLTIEATQNTAIGSKALLANTTGYQNTTLGYMAGDNITSGSGNIIIGSSVDAPSATGSNQLNIGNTLYGDLANGYLGLGTTTPTATLDVTGTLRYVDGKQAAGLILVSDASGNAGWADGDTVNSGGWTVIGSYVYNTTHNIGIGTSTPAAELDVNGRIAQTGTGQSVFLGDGAGANDDLSANLNAFVGYQAGTNNTAGANNSATGYQSLYSNSTGNRNTANGVQALYNSTANRNTANGYQALYNTTTGGKNTAVGYQTLLANTDGATNTAVGHGAFSLGTSWSNSTALGYNAEPNASNTIMLGNGSVTWIGGQVTWTAVSDERVKSNIQEDVKGLDFIMNLRPVTYHFDKDKTDRLMGVTDDSDYPEKYDIEKIKQSGFLAQEVEEAAKQAGYDFSGVKKPRDSNNYYGLSYAEFVVPLVKGMQEQQQQIQQMLRVQNKVTELEEENRQLKARLDRLEALLKK